RRGRWRALARRGTIERRGCQVLRDGSWSECRGWVTGLRSRSTLRRRLCSQFERGDRCDRGLDQAGAESRNDRRRNTLGVEPAFGEQQRRITLIDELVG